MKWKDLKSELKGELEVGNLYKAMYATDASIYKEWPKGVAYPIDEQDVVVLVKFAQKHNLSIIARTAGTSLAGQCVGNALIVDFSRHFTKILQIDDHLRWVKVQPGVIRDELNAILKVQGVFFPPNTSTSNRCMIGGMVGNNSCGSTSVFYGTTRDYVQSVRLVLSDGSTSEFNPLSEPQFIEKTKQESLEGKIYKNISQILIRPDTAAKLKASLPKATIKRRNTGYALDSLLESKIFNTTSNEEFNLSKLYAGSEGTLGLATEITLKLAPLPPKYGLLLCAHFDSIKSCMESTPYVRKVELYACELMDDIIINCTKNHAEFQKLCFFIQGSPKAVMVCETKI